MCPVHGKGSLPCDGPARLFQGRVQEGHTTQCWVLVNHLEVPSGESKEDLAGLLAWRDCVLTYMCVQGGPPVLLSCP